MAMEQRTPLAGQQTPWGRPAQWKSHAHHRVKFITRPNGSSPIDDAIAGGATSTVTAQLPVYVQDSGAPETLWSENFDGIADVTRTDSGSSAWSSDFENTEYGSGSHHGVRGDAYKMGQTTNENNNDSSVGVWRSESIDITGRTGLTLSFDLLYLGSGSVPWMMSAPCHLELTGPPLRHRRA